MRFGLDVSSAQAAVGRGMAIAYGSIWAGAWNQRWGWGGIETQLRAAKASGVVPMIQWWYWGDDISPACVENGCWDARQGVWKDKATWYRLSNELADLVERVLGPGSSALIIVETEFNKQGIETYEAFDGYLADAADVFRQRNLQVVISFGSWGRTYWTRFDRAVARADYLGTMVLQSSVRDASTYLSAADILIASAQYLNATFGKPCFVTDFAFSSYPAPGWESQQETIVRTIFARLPELKAAGVRGMVWRMLTDDPDFDTRNYHGMAERYWGLLRADGSEKPAYFAFLNGMRSEAVPAPAQPGPSQPIMFVDTPSQHATVGRTFAIGGWALDLGAAGTALGTGVDTVDVWAYPNPGSGEAPIFAGSAKYGFTRGDVAAAFQNPQWTQSGFDLTVDNLAPGTYDLAVFARSVVAKAFNKVEVVRVTVQAGRASRPLLIVDQPVNGSTLDRSFVIGGWAVDMGADWGTGIDHVDVWAYPNPGSGAPAIYLGSASYAGQRPDVAAALGSSQFTGSGFGLFVRGLAPGAYDIVTFSRSTVTGTFVAAQSVRVTVR